MNQEQSANSMMYLKKETGVQIFYSCKIDFIVTRLKILKCNEKTNICNRFISEVHPIQEIFESKMKFVELQGLDQMPTTQNEMLKVMLSFYLYNNHNNIHVHQLYISLFMSSCRLTKPIYRDELQNQTTRSRSYCKHNH